MRPRAWIVASLLAALAVTLPAGAPPAVAGPLKVLQSAPLGQDPAGVDGTLLYEASVVNVGSGPVIAIIEFCDAAGVCTGGNLVFCNGLKLARGHGCTAATRTAVGFHHARAILVALNGGNVEARGALQLQYGPYQGAVEMR